MSDKTSTDKGYFGFVLILKTYLFLQIWDFCNENLHKVIMLWIYLKQMEGENLYVGQKCTEYHHFMKFATKFYYTLCFYISYLQILKDIFLKITSVGLLFCDL